VPYANKSNRSPKNAVVVHSASSWLREIPEVILKPSVVDQHHALMSYWDLRLFECSSDIDREVASDFQNAHAIPMHRRGEKISSIGSLAVCAIIAENGSC
jgi:hypothetical protein